ncbi:MAG: radical SAM protein [Epsilonproteobacteria bacterium]|nr:radical SAM protein [Campylobacterota bacterium]
MMGYVFGPVNSRRFGLSLGIDLSPKEKSCNFDCVYCELKGAKPVKSIPNPPKAQDVIDEVKTALKKFPNIKVITITSNGEPTLYSELDELVDGLNKIKGDKKLLILSNSSTICDKSIQDTLSKMDIVKLSLDCATKRCFKRIDRPLKEIDLDNIIECLMEFGKVFKNTLVVEVLLVKGINDNIEEMQKIADILQRLKPDRVDLGTIDRPPAYDVKPVKEENLEELAKLFKGLNISLIRKNTPLKKVDFTKDELVELISHRPQSGFDIEHFFSAKSKKVLEDLLKEEKVQKRDIGGTVFYTIPR